MKKSSSGKLARRRATLQDEGRAERDQRRRGVADRRAVGDVAADRADVAHLLAGEPAHELAEIGIDRGEVGQGGGVGCGRPEGHFAGAFGDRVEARSPARAR